MRMWFSAATLVMTYAIFSVALSGGNDIKIVLRILIGA
jgi:hypothetical protein